MYNRVSISNGINYLHKAKSVLQYMEKTYSEPERKFQILSDTHPFNNLQRGLSINGRKIQKLDDDASKCTTQL